VQSSECQLTFENYVWRALGHAAARHGADPGAASAAAAPSQVVAQDGATSARQPALHDDARRVAESVRSTGGFINASRWGMAVIRTIAVPNQEKEKHTHRSRAKRFLSGRILY
jgi:hypothetical protein